MIPKRIYIYYPIILSVVLVSGILIGLQFNFTPQTSESVFPVSVKRFNKLNEIINYIEHDYVDTVSKNELVDNVINSILQQLDPHSYYITADELRAMNEPLEGNFEGIGIEFSIQNDTIVVIAPVSGGPSEKLGIEAGDRIVKVNDTLIAGIGVTNKDVMDKLRGKKGSIVKVTIYRQGQKKLLDFDIERDKIPIYSVDVSYMLNTTTGYLKLSRFSKTTFEEFSSASTKLLNQNMKNMILDLRGNGGGYLDAAVKLADEFLENGKMIVYTEGKARPKEIYSATNKGSLEKIPLIILIDEGSASASEIIAGSIQDNDRGLIIGRRSFGKGLVQEQSSWPDGSAIRLTIARYYTPTGRCIQKPYNSGTKDYFSEYYDRIEDGEVYSADSISFSDSLKFITAGGKTVYGGGGIMPDIFVPVDTTYRSAYLAELTYKGIFNQFAFEYVDKQRTKLNKFNSVEQFDKEFNESQALDYLISYAEQKGIKKDLAGIKISEEIIKNRLKASIARHIWQNDGFYYIINKSDNTLIKAIKEFEDKTSSNE
jgi:carboxyl-terminal processing protease